MMGSADEGLLRVRFPNDSRPRVPTVDRSAKAE